MELYLIRHGQSVNNALMTKTGSSENRVEDPGLTDPGRRQAELAAAVLSEAPPVGSEPIYGTNRHGYDLTHLYTSLMIRAVETGSIISNKTAVPLTAWPDVHECGGVYREDLKTGERMSRPGRGRGFFEENYPKLILPPELDETGWWKKPFEDDEARLGRTRRVVDELRRRHRGSEDRVGLITHGEFYSRLLIELLQIQDPNGFWFTLNNTGVSRIDFFESYINVVYLNRTDFLPEKLIT